MFFSRGISWCTQRVSSLGLLALLCLLYFALWHSRPSKVPRNDDKFGDRPGEGNHHSDEITNSQIILVCYTVLVHILALIFPIRLCWAIWSLTANLKRALSKKLELSKPDKQSEENTTRSEYGSSSDSDESDGALYNDFEGYCVPIWHAIILPNYKENLDTLRETLDVLGCHPQASSAYDVYLAMELGEAGSDTKAAILMKEYADIFHSIDCTFHPPGISGEAQGKSSNLSWAARHVNARYQGGRIRRNVIVTVLDADSHLSTNYFALLSGMHLAYPDTAETTIYVPPIIFDRNAHLVPTLVRVADLLWCGAGLSGHYATSSICPPTSVYSLSLNLVDRAGGWDAGETAIGEDLHMYIKCFFVLNGNLKARTILSPASQSNVHSGGRGIRGFIGDCKARYRQAIRHMWGALDSGFVVKSISGMWWESRKMTGDGRPNWTNTMVLLHRMYEAHFLPTHLALLIISTSLYMFFIPMKAIPVLLLHALDITAYFRLISILNLAVFFVLYERYHYICVSARQEEMIRAGLAEQMGDSFSYRSFKRNFLDYCVFPIAGTLFGSIPAVVALVCHFWTLKLVYSVSKKPSRLPFLSRQEPFGA